MRYEQASRPTQRSGSAPTLELTRQIAIVLWGGGVGGAETLMGDVAIAMRKRSIDASVLCIGDAMPLAERLQAAGVPCVSLGHTRGSTILLHPRRLASAIRELGSDGAIVNAAGYLPWLIRRGGYRSPMLAVEHGDALNLGTAPYRRRLRVRGERWVCANTNYVDVVVSDTLLAASTRATGRLHVRRIYNGVDLTRFKPASVRARASDSTVMIGLASRLVPGKGVEVLLDACASIGVESPWRLQIAGEGPEAAKLKAQANKHSILRERVTFLGRVSEMPSFWATCDVAVIASSQWLESFSMAAVEAMACGVPVIASSSGALPEICGEGCGALVPPSDVKALATTLREYIDSPTRRLADGEAGRRRVEQHFDLEHMVNQYLETLSEAPR